MKKALALILLLAALLGCGKPMTDGDYLMAFQEQVAKDELTFSKIEITPWPKITGLSKEERYKVLSGRAREDAKAIETRAEAFGKLKPPTALAEHHKTYQAFLNELARIKNAYADAIAAGDSMEAIKKSEEYTKLADSRRNTLRKELDKLRAGK